MFQQRLCRPNKVAFMLWKCLKYYAYPERSHYEVRGRGEGNSQYVWGIPKKIVSGRPLILIPGISPALPCSRIHPQEFWDSEVNSGVKSRVVGVQGMFCWSNAQGGTGRLEDFNSLVVDLYRLAGYK